MPQERGTETDATQDTEFSVVWHSITKPARPLVRGLVMLARVCRRRGKRGLGQTRPPSPRTPRIKVDQDGLHRRHCTGAPTVPPQYHLGQTGVRALGLVGAASGSGMTGLRAARVSAQLNRRDHPLLSRYIRWYYCGGCGCRPP
jgi:hypothetical protein